MERWNERVIAPEDVETMKVVALRVKLGLVESVSADLERLGTGHLPAWYVHALTALGNEFLSRPKGVE